MVEREPTHGEALLLQALRLQALGSECRTCRPLFETACGCAGAEAHAMLTVFVQQLRAHGRRRIMIAAPALPRVTQDEALLLTVFGCAQAEAYPELDSWLRILLAAEPPLALGASACFVAQIFALAGLTLPSPSDPALTPLPSPASCGRRGSELACAGGWPWA